MTDFLFREFCNHVYLGQWELARSCALALINSDNQIENDKQSLLSTLQNIAKNPYVAKSAWSTVPCPSFISFLSCQLLSDLGFEGEDKTWRKRADFNILLETYFKNSHSTITELSSLHSHLLNSGNGLLSFNDSDCNFKLSNERISSLKSAFIENPIAISRLLEMIYIPNDINLKSSINNTIHDIHYQYILNILKTLESKFGKKDNLKSMKELQQKVYLLLNILPESFCCYDKKKHSDEIFLSILHMCELKLLVLTKVYESLFCRSTPTLLQYFCKLQEKEASDGVEINSEALPIYFTSDGVFSHKDALLRTVNSSSHFLQDILDFCIQHVLDGNWMAAEKILKDNLPISLKPLILVLSWNLCKDDLSAINVIEAVKKWNVDGSDVILLEVYNKFKLNIMLTELCISFYQELHPEPSTDEINNKTRNILSRLQTESLLRVLQSIFGLKNISSVKIMEMLHFTEDETHSLDVNLQLTDKSIYLAYLSMTLIMEAICLSCDFKDFVVKKRINITEMFCETTENTGLTDQEENNTSCDNNESLSDYIQSHNPRQTYSKFILRKVKQAEDEIRKIYPVAYRVEILENIFSMLFSMSNVLADSTEPCIDSDEGHEGEVSIIPSKKDSLSSNDNIQSSESEKVFSGRFVISTVKLKDSNECHYPGHISSKSTESNSNGSVGLQPYTFLCNEFITKDLLMLLKDLVLEAQADAFKIIRQTDNSMNKEKPLTPIPLESTLPTNKMDSVISIKNSELCERTTRLYKYVNEALWRYEVVKSSIFQATFCVSPLHKKKNHPFKNQYSTSSSDGTDKENKKHRKKKKYKRRISSEKKESVAESSIIQCMLSSPEALLRYSLWSRNIKQAERILQAFNLKDSREAKEIVLIQELKRISCKLTENEKVKVKPLQRDLSTSVEKKSLMSNIQAIADAAASGLQSSEMGLMVHQELSSLKVSELVDVTGGVRHPELLIGSENIYSVFLADLGYSSNTSLNLSSTLFDMAFRSWSIPKETAQELDTKILSRKKMPLIRGIFRTLDMIHSLLREFLNFFESKGFSLDLQSLFWPGNESSNSFPQVLCYFIGSLDCQRFKDEINAWLETAVLLSDFHTLITEEETKQKSSTSQKDITYENKLYTTYEKLSKVLRNFRDWSSETIRPKAVAYNNYLSKLLNHLHQVTQAVLDCKKQSGNSEYEYYTSDFSILNESPVELLKKIILEGEVTPKKIEKFAIQMKVDLVQVLAQACLPHVPLLDKSISPVNLLKSCCDINVDGYPLLVVNKKKGNWLNPRHPDLSARELLKDLIEMIQDTAFAYTTYGIFSLEELFSLSDHSRLVDWMESCSEIAFVDLDLLQTREEKLAFFINVCNIAWLHAILLEVLSWRSQDKENEKLSKYSRVNLLNIASKSHIQLLSPDLVERFTMEKILGYSIGQLGSVSLFDLRYQLLHAQLPVPKHLERPPFYQLLSNPKPIWEKYAPPLEQRVLFVIVEGLLHSPKLQVMNCEIIDDELEECMESYFDFTIQIDVENEKITLPELLEWYSLDFSKDDEQELDKAAYEGLLNLLPTLVGPNLAEQFKDLYAGDSVHNFSENIDISGKKQLPFQLEFKSPSISCGIMLQYPDSSKQFPAVSLIKATSLVEAQPNVLNFMKEKCSLLHALYEILSLEKKIKNAPKENLCLQNAVKDLFSIDIEFPTTPVINLLAYYKNMHVHTSDEHSWFSSALSPTPNRLYFSHEIETCFSMSEWHKSLVFVDWYLEYFENDSAYLLLRQLILKHLASIHIPLNAMNPHCYALSIKDPFCRANTVLENVFGWSDNFAIQALKYCLSDNELLNNPNLLKLLSRKLQEITLYKKIYVASEMFGDSDVRDCVYDFKNWQEVADCSVWEQSRIIDFIKRCGKFELAVQWAELHVINKDQKMSTLAMNVTWLLTQDPPQEEAAFDIIDSFDSSECVELCDMILPDLHAVQAKLCLVQYVVNQKFSDDRQYRYHNMSLGLKMLCAIKSSCVESYIDLVAYPFLILEQMLMNDELKDAEEALKAIHEDLKNETLIEPVMSLSCVNQLVEDYASKALEVHFLDALLDDSSSSILVLSTEETLVSDEPFIMPPSVPTKNEWVPDAKILRCQVCKEERFNMFSRRHHCRRCGRVVCANCSQHTLNVEGYGNVKVRVCDDCYNVMTGSLSLTTTPFQKRYRMLSSFRSSSPRSYPGDNPVYRRRTSSINSNQQAFRWVLSVDNEQNASVRNEFSYEQTPSISLCCSILKLHNNDHRCAQFMINLCDRLLGKIKARYSGKTPAEVDFSLILGMMKSLLMNAKVKSHEIQGNDIEKLANVYLRHLDVIKLLVSANCRHLIPREIVQGDTVRKLRDKLLEEERRSLALEISTKFNFEKTGVWSSWGLFCLKTGDWPTARSKFQQFIKVLNDKNDRSKENPLLSKILKILESSVYPGTKNAGAILKSLSSLKNIKCGKTQFETDVFPLNELVKKECLFYLDLYGTHFATVEFYQKHSLISEALDYIKHKKCNPDIFIEALFIPALKNMQLSLLKHSITLSDPTLSVWSSYLFATCRHLDRLKYFNVLYEIQLFMEDYARAAQSAINFYLAPASSFNTLFERNHHLYNAKKHYEKYLSVISGSSAASWKKKKNIKLVNLKEAKSYIQIINLQEEVINFFKLCESKNLFHEIDVTNSAKSKCPPTLFGNSELKSDVVCMVLMNAVNIDEGFELSLKILKALNLNATATLCKAGKELGMKKLQNQIPHFLFSVKCLFNELVKVDEVILECVSALSLKGLDVEEIIKMLNSDSNKVNAYLMCGKLKSAYLLAVKLNSVLDVRRVMVAAEQCEQDSIQKICKKWLDQSSLKLKPKESASFQ